jgi:hypothetical protein
MIGTYIEREVSMAFLANQFMFGFSVGLVVTGGLCALTALTFKYLERSKKASDNLHEVSPILTLLKSDGIWYIESLSDGSVIDVQEIDNEKIEEIIGDYIAGQIALVGEKYIFDIRCSNGEEYSVHVEKKSLIDDKVTNW